MLATAGRLELLGPLGIDFGLDAESGGGAFASDLFRSHHQRCAEAWDLPRVHSALTWYEGFRAASPSRVPFVPAFGAEALRGQLHNRLTLDLFAEFMRRSTPMGTTRCERLSSDAITSYVGVIRSLRSREARYEGLHQTR